MFFMQNLCSEGIKGVGLSIVWKHWQDIKNPPGIKRGGEEQGGKDITPQHTGIRQKVELYPLFLLISGVITK